MDVRYLTYLPHLLLLLLCQQFSVLMLLLLLLQGLAFASTYLTCRRTEQPPRELQVQYLVSILASDKLMEMVETGDTY